MLEINLLGKFSVVIDGRDCTPALARGKFAPLFGAITMSACAGATEASRACIARCLWPHMPAVDGSVCVGAVMSALLRAEPALRDYLVLDANALHWRRPDVRVDAREFAEAVKAGRWARAEALYGGDFLAGERDGWAQAIREGLRLEYLHVLEQLIQRCNAEGHAADALRHARKLVRLEPMRESGYQLLMHFAAAQRDFALVHAAYYQCERLMKARLNAQPNLATRTTYERCAGMAAIQRPAVQHVFAY